MLFQICLLAAGIHLGRTLLKKRDQGPGSPPAPSAPPAPSESPLEAPAEPPLLADPDETAELAAAPEPRAAALTTGAAADADTDTAAEATAQRQLEIAAVSTGLTLVPGAQRLGGLALLYGSLPAARRAVRQLADGHVGSDLLESLSVLASLATGQLAFSSLLFLLLSAAQKARVRTEQEARSELLRLAAPPSLPAAAWVLRDGVEVSIPLGELLPGDRVVVDAGGTIPVEGLVVEGRARLRPPPRSSAPPSEVTIGDTVCGLAVVLSGRIHVQVLHPGRSTAVASLAAIGSTLQHTAELAATVEAEARKVADDSALVMLALSAVSSTLGARGRQAALALLSNGTADNMCALLPTSLLNSLRTAYQQGVLLKDARALQQLARVDTVLFAGSSALTQGQLQVHELHAVRGVSEDELLRVAYGAELRPHHPVAQALVDEARRRGHVVAAGDGVRSAPGYGPSARQGSRLARVGSPGSLEAHGVKVPDSLLRRERTIHQQGRFCVYVAQDRSLLGLIELQPRLHPETAAVLRTLRERDQCLYLLSGNHEAPTRALAEQLQLDHFAARLSPLDKARLIADLQRSGRRICAVGDGLSDALALQQALVSVSLAGAATAAEDSAQIVLLDSDLRQLPPLFALASRSRRSLDHLFLASALPTAVALGGICLAGFTQNTVQLLQLVSLVISGALTAQTVPEDGA